MEDATRTAVRAGWREWTGLAVLVLPGVIVSMDLAVLFLAVPFVSADLRPTGSQLLWITDIYGFLLAGLLIIMGALGDRLGRRRLLLIGAAAFAIASLIAAYSTSAIMLIAARALLGIAGATLAPSTLSLLRNIFHDPTQRQTAIGIWTAGFAGGALLGPIVGGFLLEHFWWGSVFLLNIPAMVLLLLLGGWLLPEFRDPKPGSFDLLSAVLSLAAVLLVVYGVKRAAEDGVHWLAGLAAATGLAVGFIFLRRQRHLANPLIDLGLLRNRTFATALAAGTLALFGMVGFGLFTSQYLQLVLGKQPLQAALWMMPSFGAMIVGASAAAPLRRALPSAYVAGGALAIAALGCVILTQLPAQSGLAVMVVGHAILAGGVGVTVTLATDMVVAAAPSERAGVASALSETCNEFGSALGIAILGSIGTAVYHHRVLDGMHTELPPDAAAAAKSLGGAIEVAGTLPGQLGPALLEGARIAFTEGITVAAFVGAGLLTGTAIAVTLSLRKSQPASDQKPVGVRPS